MASVEVLGRSLLQCSQFGLISSMILLKIDVANILYPIILLTKIVHLWPTLIVQSGYKQ